MPRKFKGFNGALIRRRRARGCNTSYMVVVCHAHCGGEVNLIEHDSKEH